MARFFRVRVLAAREIFESFGQGQELFVPHYLLENMVEIYFRWICKRLFYRALPVFYLTQHRDFIFFRKLLIVLLKLADLLDLFGV